MRDSIEFLESQLSLGSRIDLISNHIGEIMDTLRIMIQELGMDEEMKVALQSLYVRASSIAEKVKEMARERESRNLKPSSRSWE